MPKQVKAVPVDAAAVEPPKADHPTVEVPEVSTAAPKKKRNYTMTPGRAEALRRANEARIKRQTERDEIRRRDEEDRRQRELDERIGSVMEKYLSKYVTRDLHPVETKSVSRGQVSRRRMPAMTGEQRSRYEQKKQARFAAEEDADEEESEEDDDDEGLDENTNYVQKPNRQPATRPVPVPPQQQPAPQPPSHHQRMYSMIFGR